MSFIKTNDVPCLLRPGMLVRHYPHNLLGARYIGVHKGEHVTAGITIHGGTYWQDATPPEAIDLGDALTRDAVRAWAMEAQCGHCDGDGLSAFTDRDGTPLPCVCQGKVPKPTSLDFTRNFPPQEQAQALAWAVARLVAGEPVRGFYEDWEGDESFWSRELPGYGIRAEVDEDEGWWLEEWRARPHSFSRGPEIGDAGRAIVDGHLAERGYWLRGGIFKLPEAS